MVCFVGLCCVGLGGLCVINGSWIFVSEIEMVVE